MAVGSETGQEDSSRCDVTVVDTRDEQGQCLFESEQDGGWDRRRFVVPVHQQFSMFQEGGPALEASRSHPALKLAMALAAPFPPLPSNPARFYNPPRFRTVAA